MNAYVKVEKYKFWLVAKLYFQVQGIDFGDIFSLIVKLDFITFLLYDATTFYFEVEKIYVKITFLHGDLEEEIYMKQPEKFSQPGLEHLVCKLKKSFYGLK